MNHTCARRIRFFKPVRDCFDSPVSSGPSGGLIIALIFTVLYTSFIWSYGWKYRNIDYYDLPSFYSASVQVFRYGESPYNQQSLQRVMEPDIRVYPYLYPPPSLLLFWPLSFVSYASAGLIVLLLNHLLILVLLWCIPICLLRYPENNVFRVFIITIVYFLNCYPVVSTLKHGQVNMLFTGFLLAFWIFTRKDKAVSASLFLALAILLKVYPLVLIPPLFIAARKREAVYTVIWLTLLSGVSLIFIPLSVWTGWFTQVLPAGGYGRTATGLVPPAAIWNQSLNGFFARLFTNNEYSSPMFVNPGLAKYLTFGSAGIVAVVTGVAAWLCSKRHAMPVDRIIMLTLVAIYLIAPFSWEHHLVYLVPPILLLLTAHCRLTGVNKLVFHGVCIVSAVIIAMPFMLPYKFYAVLMLWIICLFTALSKTIALPLEISRKSGV
jgi:uncharacterized membrane protein YkvA (DUF1232 family)